MNKIIRKKELNPTVTQMEIYAPLVAKKAKPGQFIILRVNEEGERIPLTVAGTNAEEGTVKIIFQIVGATTQLLNAKNEGEYIQDFVGPLGVATHTEGIKKVCIVGGGVGCAIAMPVAQEFHRLGAEVTSIIGFRSSSDLVPGVLMVGNVLFDLVLAAVRPLGESQCRHQQAQNGHNAPFHMISRWSVTLRSRRNPKLRVSLPCRVSGL